MCLDMHSGVEKSAKGSLLHWAVGFGTVDMVRKICQTKPEMVNSKWRSKTPFLECFFPGIFIEYGQLFLEKSYEKVRKAEIMIRLLGPMIEYDSFKRSGCVRGQKGGSAMHLAAK